MSPRGQRANNEEKVLRENKSPRRPLPRQSDRQPTRQASSRALAEDSLAYAFHKAAILVSAVLSGENLTDRYERMLREHPDWPDSTRGAVRDLCWSTLRAYGRGDGVLRTFLHKPPPVEVHALLLLAVQRLEARPEQAHTIVDQAVEAVAVDMPGFKGMVNGVLRNVLREASSLAARCQDEPEARYAHPAWWIARLKRDLPDRWEAVLAAGNLHPPMSLRVNRRKTTVEAMLDRLGQAGIDARPLTGDAIRIERAVAVSRIPGFEEGWVSVQDAGAQQAAQRLNLQDGLRVLDACAAPGGKTAHILETADVELTALELDPQRAQRVTSNLQRLGLSAQVKVADCRQLSAWWDGKPFDRILADVPCSASGVVRRHPDIKWLRRNEDISGFARQQAEILDALWQTLAPGGTMLYASCSVFDEENIEQIKRFKRRHPEAIVPNPDAEELLRLLPDADHDGFFYAQLHKPG